MAILEKSWVLDDAHVAGSPSVMMTSNGTRIIIGTSDGDIVALKGDSKEAWRTAVRGTVSTWPTIDEVPGFGLSILTATDNGAVVCLSPEGEIHWTTRLEGKFTPYNNVSVLRGGERAAIVATDRRGVVTGLTAGGEIVWEFSTHEEHIWQQTGVGPAAVGDIDGDGRDEIAFSAADGYVYCLDCDGTFRWNVYVGTNSQWTGTVMADLGEGPCVLCGGTTDFVHCISPDGKLLWKQQGAGAGFIEVGIAVGDINGDGKNEVVVVHQGRAVEAFDGNGEILWSKLEYDAGDQPFCPSIADMNGDGSMEILHTMRHGTLLRVLKNDGSLLEEHTLTAGMVGAPVVADIDDDGKLEILTVSMADGSLTCFNSNAPAGQNAAQWPTSRGFFDGRANHLAAVETTTPRQETPCGDAALRRVSPERLVLGANALTYEWNTDAAAVVEVTATGPDGVTKRAVVGGKRRTSMNLEILEPGCYALTAKLISTETGEFLGKVTEHTAAELFIYERAEVESLLAQFGRLADSAGDVSCELDRVRRRLALRWLDIEERIDEYEFSSDEERRLFIEEADEIRSALRREVACQHERLAVMAESGKPVDFLAWQLAHPWKEFAPEFDTPQAALSEIQIRTDGGGHEALAVQIANVLSSPLDVRVWLDQISDDNGQSIDVTKHLELRQVTWVPAPAGGDGRSEEPRRMGADALPELGNAGILRLAPSSSGRLWVDVLTKDLPAGTYTTTLHMRALTLTGGTLDVPVTWTVEPVALPDAMPLKFCNWANGYTRHFAHAPDVALEDLQDHYTSVFVGGPTIQVTYDAEGNLVSDTGWEAQDEYLAKMRPQNVVLYHAMPLIPAEGAPGQGSEAWEKAFAAFLPRWTEHMAEIGFDYKRWALYPVDEPGIRCGTLINKLEKFARFVKNLDKNIQIYTDPYRGMIVADYERLRDVVDIVQPSQYYVVLAENSDRIDYIRSTDQTHWIYEAGPSVKDAVLPTYYWEQIWSAWEIGFTGIGYWTYCTTGRDLWEAGADYVMVYQGAKGPVPSARWQAIRIGIEDYARMARLRDAVATARDAGKTEAADNAEKRLVEMVAEAKATRWEPILVARIRNEVIDLTMALAQ